MCAGQVFVAIRPRAGLVDWDIWCGGRARPHHREMATDGHRKIPHVTGIPLAQPAEEMKLPRVVN